MKRQLIAALLLASGAFVSGSEQAQTGFKLKSAGPEQLSTELNQLAESISNKRLQYDVTNVKDLHHVAIIAMNVLKEVRLRQQEKVASEQIRLDDADRFIAEVNATYHAIFDKKPQEQKSDASNGGQLKRISVSLAEQR